MRRSPRLVAPLLLALAACSGVSDGPPAADASQTDDGGVCLPEGEQTHPLLPAPHVTDIGAVMYNSNPPSSGPHCGQWGNYGVYTASRPLPRCNWIHNLEHGAVVLLYNCPTGCPAIVAALSRVVTEARVSASCPMKPIIITPDPALDVTVAAAAWGYTWRSSCLDQAAIADLVRFVTTYSGPDGGKAPERLLACP